MNESKNVRKNVSMMLTGMVIGAAAGAIMLADAFENLQELLTGEQIGRASCRERV